MAEITVRLLAGDDGEKSRKMLRDFSSDIARLEGVKPSTDAATRGDPVTLGMIVLAAVKSGALTALINMIANYVNRDRRNEIEFTSANGEKIRVSSPCNLTQLEGTVRRLFPASDDRFTRITTDDQPLRKIAILVANDKFEKAGLPDLHCTQNDALELQKTLEDEICGFKTYVYLNESSYNIRANLNRICRDLSKDDTLLFYYAGHGKVDGNELCLITQDTILDSLDATSIRAEHDVLRYFRRTFSERKIVVLDCCHSGVIADRFRGNDLESTLNSLSRTYGTYILTASSATERAEEREKDGHGVFTKALLDCLSEGGKESITINDLYSYTYARLARNSQQTPRLTILEQVGEPIEIGNYRQRIRIRNVEETKRLVANASMQLEFFVLPGRLSAEKRDYTLSILKQYDINALLPHQKAFRDDVILFVEGKKAFAEVFEGTGNSRIASPPEPPPVGPAPIPPALQWTIGALSRKEYMVSNDTPEEVRQRQVREAGPEDGTERVLKLDSAVAECSRLMERVLNNGECWVFEIDPENRFIIKLEASAATPCIRAKASLIDTMTGAKARALRALGWKVSSNYLIIKITVLVVALYFTLGVAAAALLNRRVRDYFNKRKANRSWMLTTLKDALIDAAAVDLTLALRGVAREAKTIIVRRQ